jgi:glycosyltransferase involved in cell wall biosynthesis
MRLILKLIQQKSLLVDGLKNTLRSIRDRQVISNVFGSNSISRALLIYTIYPFKNGDATHSNAQEARAIAAVLDELGFAVDICHYTTNRKIDYPSYTLLFGFGVPFENSFDERFELKRIYYATGAHVFHQNHSEIRRVSEVNIKNGTRLLPKRVVPWTWSKSTALSDLLIVVGNNWTKATYSRFTKNPIVTINVTALTNEKSVSIQRNIANTKTNFVWFGSTGSIHKGLDLCVEIFSTRPNIDLHICGPRESDFFEAFESKLRSKNIHFHGFVDVSSDKFLEIVSKCSFAILPTCSEGQATSLLTMMAAGVIPIATIYSGIDLDNTGVIINGLNEDGVNCAIDVALTFSNEQIYSKSEEVKRIVASSHTIDSYRNSLKEILKKTLNND